MSRFKPHTRRMTDPTFLVPNKDMIHLFNSGEWALQSGSAIANDAVNYKTGTQGVKVTAINTPTTMLRTKSLDLYDKILYVAFWCDDETKISSIWVSFDVSSNWSTYFVGAISDSIKTGWNIYPIFPMNMNHLGSTPPTDIQLSSIKRTEIRVTPVAGQTVNVTFDRIFTVKNPLTKGKLSIHFDDGHNTVFSQAKPIMDKYGFTGTTYVITDQVGAANRMTLDQLKILQELGWDIASHTKTHPSFISSGLTLQQVEDELRLSQEWLMNNGFSRGLRHFTAPGSSIQFNQEILALIKKYYATHRTMVGYEEAVPVANYNHVMARLVVDTTSVAMVQGWIDSAIKNKSWLNLIWHYLVTPTTGSTEYTPTNFQAIVDYVGTRLDQIDVVTMSDMLNFDVNSRMTS